MPTPPQSDEDKAKLSAIYNDPASHGSFGGVQRLFRAARESGLPNIKREQVKEWIESHDTYTRYRTQRKKFPRRQIQSFDINWLWELDLAFMVPFWHSNEGIRYLLCKIDVLSKVAHVIPMHDKTDESVVAAYEKLFTQAGTVPKFISSDKGKEFISKAAVEVFKDRGITAYTLLNKTGVPTIERFIRTLKSRIYRYMDANNTKRYIAVLQQIVDAYNKTKHSTIGMAPADVRPEHVQQILLRVYDGPHIRKRRQRFKYKFQMWQLVRVFIKPETFMRGFHQQFSDEIFVICKRMNTLPPTYRICPLLLTKEGYPQHQQFVEIEGAYYEHELVAVTRVDNLPKPTTAAEPSPQPTITSAPPEHPPPPEHSLPSAVQPAETDELEYSDWEAEETEDRKKQDDEHEYSDWEAEEGKKEETPPPPPRLTPPPPPPPTLRRPILPRQAKIGPKMYH